jgi:hypothetical protein
MSRPRIPTAPAHSGLARRPLAQPQIRAEAKTGSHVIVFIIVVIVIVVIIRRLRRWLPWEPVPLLPPMMPFQGIPSPRPLAGPSFLRVLLLLLLRSDPPRGSVHHVLWDRWQKRLVKPHLLETDENLSCENPRAILHKKEEGADTHQGYAPALRAHRGLGKSTGVQLSYRGGYPPMEVIGGEGDRGHLRTLQVDPQHHLRKRQSPLHQGEHPPGMDGGNHPRGGEPSISQLLQSLQKGLEILLSLARGPIAPVGAGGGHHSLRKRWEPPLVVPKVKPPALPPLVRRGKDGGDVLLRTRLPQLKDAATGPHRHANSPLPRRQGKRLRGEEMGPQIPVGVNPQTLCKPP